MRQPTRGNVKWFLAGFSVAYCVVCIAVAAGTGLDGDFSFFWTSGGRLFCLDTFEDNSLGNTLTLREFSDWLAEVRFRYVNGAVEAGEEVPFVETRTGYFGPGTGDAVQVWVDDNYQPARQKEPGAHLCAPMKVTAIFQVPQPGIFHVFLIVCAWAVWGVAAALIRWRPRREVVPGLCRHCSYNLTGNVSGVCPEGGTEIERLTA